MRKTPHTHTHMNTHAHTHTLRVHMRERENTQDLGQTNNGCNTKKKKKPSTKKEKYEEKFDLIKMAFQKALLKIMKTFANQLR